MSEIFEWFLDLRNSKIAALLIFFTTFIGIIIYIYGSKKRSERLETYRNIPFLDDDNDELNPHQQSVKNDSSRNNGK